MRLRYTVTTDINNVDIETLDEAINQYNFCLKHQSEKNFVLDLMKDRHADIEVTSIEEV